MAPVAFVLRAGSWENESYSLYSDLVPPFWKDTDPFKKSDIIIVLANVQLVTLVNNYNITCIVDYLFMKMELTSEAIFSGRWFSFTPNVSYLL